MNADRPLILVTGRDGQVGYELCRTLAPLGQVVGLTRSQLDLTNPSDLVAQLRQRRPALVVNPAAYTAVDRAEQEESLALAINAQAPGVLAEECGRLGIPLVHYSTDYVFDGSSQTPYREGDPPCPLGAYGRTKLAGEQAVAAGNGQWLVLRTAWVYGRRGRNFLLTMERLAKERDTLRVVDDQRGAPTWSRLIAEATAAILARCRTSQGRFAIADYNGLYHLTASGETSWYGFAQAIFELGSSPRPQIIPITTADYPTTAARPSYSVLDNQRLYQTFGLILPDWRESLALAMDRFP